MSQPDTHTIPSAQKQDELASLVHLNSAVESVEFNFTNICNLRCASTVLKERMKRVSMPKPLSSNSTKSSPTSRRTRSRRPVSVTTARPLWSKAGKQSVRASSISMSR